MVALLFSVLVFWGTCVMGLLLAVGFGALSYTLQHRVVLNRWSWEKAKWEF